MVNKCRAPRVIVRASLVRCRLRVFIVSLFSTRFLPIEIGRRRFKQALIDVNFWCTTVGSARRVTRNGYSAIGLLVSA